MKRSRFSDEQIIGIPKEHQAGPSATELCRKHGISDATFYTYGRLSRCKAGDLLNLRPEPGIFRGYLLTPGGLDRRTKQKHKWVTG